MPIDLQFPIWGIEHIATALQLSIDTAHEYTYRPDFPAPKTPFKKNLWLRDDVLTWFARLPDRDRGDDAKATTRAKATGRPLGAGTALPGAAAKRIKAYTPRGSK